MGDISANTLIELIGLVVVLIANALAMFRYIAGMRDTLTEKIFAEVAKADMKIDAVARETRLLIEKASESESKSRQEFSSFVTGSLNEARRDGKTLEDKLNTMQREMIRRSDLTEIRQEIMGAIDRQERSCNEALSKLEKRVEMLFSKSVSPSGD
jgi:uncharacterized protein with von Willebrand factor type A (vWA) domain